MVGVDRSRLFRTEVGSSTINRRTTTSVLTRHPASRYRRGLATNPATSTTISSLARPPAFAAVVSPCPLGAIATAAEG